MADSCADVVSGTTLTQLPRRALLSILAESGNAKLARTCKALSGLLGELLAHQRHQHDSQLFARFLLSSLGAQSCARRAFAACEASGLLSGLPEQRSDALVSSVLAGLAELGAEVDLHDAFLLSAAAKAGYAGALDVLLAKLRFGPSAFALSRALTAAAQNGRARAVAALLRAGAPAAAYNSAALQAAAQGGNAEVVYRLCAAGADPTADGGTALCAAVCGGHTAAARVLLQYGADPRARCSAALLHACELPAATVAALVAVAPFASAGAAKSKGKDADSPMSSHEAVVLELVSLLLAAGADARAHGRAGLEAAAARGYERVVRLLLGAGADPAACNSSALVAASVQGHEGVVGLLLESGADPWDMSSLALRTASERGFGPVVQMLRAAAASRAPTSTQESLVYGDSPPHNNPIISGAFAMGRGSSGDRVCRSTGGNATAEALALAMAAAASRGGGGAPEISGTGHARRAPVVLLGASGAHITSGGQHFLSGANAVASANTNTSASHAAYACSGRRPLPLRMAKSSRHWNVVDPSRSPASGASHAACVSHGHGHAHGAAGGGSGSGGSGGRSGGATLAAPSGWRRHATDGVGSAAASPSHSASTNIVSTTQYGAGSTAMMSTMATGCGGSMMQTTADAAALAGSGAVNACMAPKEGGWPVHRGAGAVPVGLALGQGVVLGPIMHEAFRSLS
ncbi:hypothetical protein HXX76_008373 [Chlamydomonas incerta]|uniref:Uncharacterized protein n=1 Tax=Chlamydomonas incerta TaxID=51695 RepID=A0A835SXI8_CHLIN|nr:hypothetical protein HXX76_008373 [Chlamydomonas incerta]|eukprot:KAG2433307.1 hypothetical protein HXX76_008373 [Chlamydomonas incerta]